MMLFPLSTLSADLSDFKKDVESTEQIAPQEKKTEEPPETDNSLLNLLVDLFKFIWWLNTSTVTYQPYPYYDSNYDLKENRRHWFSADLQAMGLSNLGYGTWATLKGHFLPFFGPYLEGWSLSDGKSNLSGIRLGATIPLYQSDPFSLGLYGQWNTWIGILERTGGTLGLEFRAHPFPPISLQGKAGFQIFQNFSMGELEAQIGWNKGPWELFAGWRYWNLLTNQGVPLKEYAGAFGGIKVYF